MIQHCLRRPSAYPWRFFEILPKKTVPLLNEEYGVFAKVDIPKGVVIDYPTRNAMCIPHFNIGDFLTLKDPKKEDFMKISKSIGDRNQKANVFFHDDKLFCETGKKISAGQELVLTDEQIFVKRWKLSDIEKIRFPEFVLRSGCLSIQSLPAFLAFIKECDLPNRPESKATCDDLQTLLENYLGNKDISQYPHGEMEACVLEKWRKGGCLSMFVAQGHFPLVEKRKLPSFKVQSTFIYKSDKPLYLLNDEIEALRSFYYRGLAEEGLNTFVLS